MEVKDIDPNGGLGKGGPRVDIPVPATPRKAFSLPELNPKLSDADLQVAAYSGDSTGFGARRQQIDPLARK